MTPLPGTVARWVVRPVRVRETVRVHTGNVEFSGVPAGHSSNHPAGGTSAATQG